MAFVLLNRIVDAMGNCGCNPSQSSIIEFPIEGNNNNIFIDDITFPIIEDDDLDGLKNKVICEFKDILNKLKCGIQPDLSIVLDDILKVYIKAGF